MITRHLIGSVFVVLLPAAIIGCGGSGDQPHSIATASTHPPPPCRMRQLDTTLRPQGGAGSLIGAVRLRNRGRECTLVRQVRATIRDEHGNVLARGISERGSSSAQSLRLAGNGSSQRAAIQVVWSNWCGSRRGSTTLDIAIPRTGTKRRLQMFDSARPSCLYGDGSTATRLRVAQLTLLRPG